MGTYLVTYHGGGMPETEAGRTQAQAAFAEWVERVGDALIDPGAPLAGTRTVMADGVQNAPPPGPIAGYSLVRADDLDQAAALLADHPFVRRGGALQVSEAASP